jgi:hypothetical protein
VTLIEYRSGLMSLLLLEARSAFHRTVPKASGRRQVPSVPEPRDQLRSRHTLDGAHGQDSNSAKGTFRSWSRSAVSRARDASRWRPQHRAELPDMQMCGGFAGVANGAASGRKQRSPASPPSGRTGQQAVDAPRSRREHGAGDLRGRLPVDRCSHPQMPQGARWSLETSACPAVSRRPLG